MAAIKFKGGTTDEVLGTHDEFMDRMSSNPTEQKLAGTSIQKYMQDFASHGMHRGAPFRDASVVTLGGEPLQLATLQQPGRPLLLNFGSCS